MGGEEEKKKKSPKVVHCEQRTQIMKRTIIEQEEVETHSSVILNYGQDAHVTRRLNAHVSKEKGRTPASSDEKLEMEEQ